MKRGKPLARSTPLKTAAPIKRGGPRLRRGRSTGIPTKAEARHIETIKAGACVACEQNPGLGLKRCDAGGCDAHHTLSGGRRRGHGATLGCCAWHHRGIPPSGYSNPEATAAVFGPSLHHHRKRFIATYGTDDALLARQAASVST